MNFLSVFMAVFSVLGALDLIIGNKFGIGKEFEKGFMLFGNLALSMIGMIVIAPIVGNIIAPVSEVIYNYTHIDPSVFPAMIFANDMGGAPLAASIAKSESFGLFNGLVVASMMGCTVSFTIPFALNTVKQENHKFVLFGFLCGILTIPVGCFVAGIIAGVQIASLLLNLMPLIIFSALIAVGLIYLPKLCIRIFMVLGNILKTLIIFGLALGIISFLTGYEVIKGLETMENAAMICLNASVVMTGAFPFLYILARIIKKPLGAMGKKLEINEASTMGFFNSLAASITTFNEMERMDKKGIVLNSAFAISAAFVFADHLAFTMSYNSDYIAAVIAGKLISGILAVFAAAVLYKKIKI